MLMPSIFAENLFDEFFEDFPMPREFRNIDRRLYGKNAAREMKTDVHEHEDHYEVDIDLPGFKKDEITLTLENGYLTVNAAKGVDKDETDKRGKLIRQERYAGALQRSFYVGDALTEQDIAAKFENGVLSLSVPKQEARKLPEKKVIMIEG
ncbi:MAG: Hsp20/alpha crystallin family protein [Clostridia bacterium]|nr:Hsp20/alpha crystallin family protein [Clostridia bacterium]